MKNPNTCRLNQTAGLEEDEDEWDLHLTVLSGQAWEKGTCWDLQPRPGRSSVTNKSHPFLDASRGARDTAGTPGSVSHPWYSPAQRKEQLPMLAHCKAK